MHMRKGAGNKHWSCVQMLAVGERPPLCRLKQSGMESDVPGFEMEEHPRYQHALAKRWSEVP